MALMRAILDMPPAEPWRLSAPNPTACGVPPLTEPDRRLIAALQEGLPLVSRPYAELGVRVGMTEEEVMVRLAKLLEQGVIKRLGVIVRHHELGYRANAMVVWDISDEQVTELGRKFGEFDFVTLCYRRPRWLPHWPYNLFCMIHGQDRETVKGLVRVLVDACGLQQVRRDILFSGRRFKQCGARYLDLELTVR
jgi:DNA-binding Lrp family transcriptional regulator